LAKKKILFVCTGNIDRSPTAEVLLSNNPLYEARSAGTWRHAYRRVSGELVEWADLIFVMEDHHKESLVDSFPEAEDKIIVLDIPDITEAASLPVGSCSASTRSRPYLESGRWSWAGSPARFPA